MFGKKVIISSATVVATATLIFSANVSAFAPTRPFKMRSRTVGKIAMHMSTTKKVERNNINTEAFAKEENVEGMPLLLEEDFEEEEEDVEASAQKTKAVEALEKLLARQKVEVAETERLLERFSGVEECNINQMCEEEIDFGDSLSIASSIVSGADYGFQSRSQGATFDQLKSGQKGFHGPPANVAALGSQQFMRNLNAIKGEYKDELQVALTDEQKILQNKLNQLTLNSTAIWERELTHGPIEAPLLIKVPYIILCYFLDVVFEGRYTPARFFLLETVARMPYFAYITMLHFYETMGFWRRSADIKRIHFAEEINEFRHLLIMESLGGDQRWWVRFMAQHSALAYYVVLCFLWAVSPTLSYKFSELLETHAVNTYSQFLDENEELLKELPPSLAAVEYYAFGISDPFYAEFQTTAIKSGTEIRRPGEQLSSLYDVFSAIRDDEGDHVSTMTACMDPDVAVNSPSLEKRILTGVALVAVAGYALGTGDFLNPGDLMSDFEGVSGLEAVVGEAADAMSSVDESSLSNLFMDGGLLGGLSGIVQKVFMEDDSTLELGAEMATDSFQTFVEQVVEIVTRFL